MRMELDPVKAAEMRESRKALYEAIGARNEELEREARRDRRRTLVLGAILGWIFCLVGLLGVGASLNATSEDVGRVWFWGGLAVGNGGMLAAFVWTYQRLRERDG